MPREFWKDEAPPKGIANRNAAIDWLLGHVNDVDNNNNNNNKNNGNGVVYIADDDNTYDLQLFEEVRIFFFAE
jgi:hypothetical protein